MIDEESETEEEEDIDTTLEEAINRATRTEKVKRSLREIIASITAEQLVAIAPSSDAAKKTPTKSSVSTSRACNKRKGTQPSRGAAII